MPHSSLAIYKCMCLYSKGAIFIICVWLVVIPFRFSSCTVEDSHDELMVDVYLHYGPYVFILNGSFTPKCWIFCHKLERARSGTINTATHLPGGTGVCNTHRTRTTAALWWLALCHRCRTLHQVLFTWNCMNFLDVKTICILQLQAVEMHCVLIFNKPFSNPFAD